MSIRTHLRNATKESHQRLDRQFAQLEMFSSMQGYRDYLACMQAMQIHFGASVHRVAAKSDLPVRTRTIEGCLRADLASDIEVIEYPETTRCIATANEPTSEDWGVAYVVEGSALGGRYLMAAASKRLPSSATTHFLRQLAEDAQLRWPRFLCVLESATIEWDKATEAALAVFDFVEGQVNARLHPLSAPFSQ